MKRLGHICRSGVLLLGLPLAGAAWIQVPSREGAPAFRCQAQEVPGGFRFQVVPEASNPDAWAVQLWVADEAMVQRRRQAIAEAQKAVREARELLSDADHGGKDCQATIHRFIEQSEGALRRLRDYDPFRQSVWTFSEPGPGEAALPRHSLSRSGAFLYTGSFRFDRNLDAATPMIRRLAWALALVPKADLRTRPIRDPWTLALGQAWAVIPQLSPSQALLLKLAGGTGSGALLTGKDGYTLAELGEVGEAGCYGVEGTYHCPDLWKPMPAPAVRTARPLPEGLQVVGLGPVLAVRAGNKDWTLIDLAGRLSSAVEEGWEILDLQRGPKGDVYLLAQGSGMTRPHGGSGNCGAGTEVDVVWVHIGPDGRKKKNQAVHVIQCDGSTGYDFVYDPLQPGRGFKVKRVDPQTE